MLKIDDGLFDALELNGAQIRRGPRRNSIASLQVLQHATAVLAVNSIATARRENIPIEP